MKIAIQTDDGQIIAAVEFNTVQIVRCIKRARGPQPVTVETTDAEGNVIPGGVPIPWPVIGPAEIAAYIARPILETGESYKQQMANEDNAIFMAEVAKTPQDRIGAMARADAIIADLNDPAK
jgi:hypothetical protein